MSNSLIALLKQWYPQRDSAQWVLATIYKTTGPSYRKAGSMMLFSSEGHQLGMLSGGCLETDIQKKARRVMASGEGMLLSYDGRDEDDLAFHLGIGCGGRVWIMLQPVTATEDYLQLSAVYQTLLDHGSGYYYQRLLEQQSVMEAQFIADSSVGQSHDVRTESCLTQEGESLWLKTRIQPPPHLLIVGGGIDARPLAILAHHLGWRISIWDPRPANARAEHFPQADRLLRGDADLLRIFVQQQHVNAAVIMTHHVDLDAQGLVALNASGLSYMSMLGPVNRRDRVLSEAGLALTECKPMLAGPAGLDLRAELPETIALSILAECQARIAGGSGQSLSEVRAE